MHVCLMNSASEWGGGERMFLELALGFRAAGHTVTLVCRPGSVLAARVPTGVEACLLPCRGDLDVGTVAALYRLLRKRAPAAVFCNWGRDCVLAGLSALPLRIPVVRIKAMAETRRNLRNLFIYRVLLSAVVSVSHPVHAGLRALGIPPQRLHVIHNGIEVPAPGLDRAAARARFAVGPDRFVVAYTGRLVREKGVDVLPEVAARLVAEAVPLRLLVTGDGPLRAELEGACRARGLDACVRFLGFLDDPLPVLVAADAAVMPSRTEAFPVAALETLALGVPLVACRVGGLVEVVGDEQTALLVEPDDPSGLTTALLRLHGDPQLAARLSRHGRARVGEFSRARMIERYVQVIRALKPPQAQT